MHENLSFLTLWLTPSLGALATWAQAQPQRGPLIGTNKVAPVGKEELPGVIIAAICIRGNRSERATQPV